MKVILKLDKISRAMKSRRYFTLALLINPYLLAIFTMLVSVYVFTDIGFHKWHGSHLTPHILGVSLNLSETNLLCNSLIEGCDSYHRHPPLYFYVNLFLSKFALDMESYVKFAMATSIIFNYSGIILLMRTYGKNRTEKYIILLLSTSSILFIVNLTLSTYDSFIVLLFSMFAMSEKEKSNSLAYISIFLAMVLSWYFILAGSVYTIYRLYNRNYKALLPFIAGLFTTGYFLMSGSEYFYENFVSATENIDFSANVNKERLYSKPEMLKMLAVNLYYLLSPTAILICVFALINFKKCMKLAINQPLYVYFPIIVFLIWNTVFFRWSLVHNFIFLMLIPFYIPLCIEVVRTLSRPSTFAVACLSVLVTVQMHKNILDGYHDLSAFENVGVEIFTEAIHRYGYSNN